MLFVLYGNYLQHLKKKTKSINHISDNTSVFSVAVQSVIKLCGTCANPVLILWLIIFCKFKKKQLCEKTASFLCYLLRKALIAFLTFSTTLGSMVSLVSSGKVIVISGSFSLFSILFDCIALCTSCLTVS